MNLKKWRKNLSQQNLADILNLQQTTYSDYERGVTEPTLSSLVKLANFYNISLDELAERGEALKSYNFDEYSQAKQDVIYKIINSPEKLVYRIDAYINVLTNQDLVKPNYSNLTFKMDLKERRKKTNLLQKELAKKITIEPATYCNYENGTTEPPLSVLIKLADFYKISLDALVGRRPHLSDYGLQNLSDIKKDAILKVLNVKEDFVYRIDAYIDVLTNRDLPSANYLNNKKGDK